MMEFPVKTIGLLNGYDPSKTRENQAIPAHRPESAHGSLELRFDRSCFALKSLIFVEGFHAIAEN
jgi:hypothetical protein